MSLRRAKQILYAGFFALFWYLVFAGIYYLRTKPAPTCFDGIQNQGEQGIDCGGPCALACLPAGIKPIELVEDVITFQPDQTHLSLLAHVTNPSFNFTAKSFQYTFSLYNDAEQLVQSFSGSSLLYAREVKYILLPGVSLPQVSFSKVDFQAQNTDWVPKDSYPAPQISISSFTPKISGRTVIIDGEATNKDTVMLPRVTILAIFRGRFGEPAGATQTEIENLMPGQTQPFSLIHPALLNIDTAGAQVFAYAKRP